MPKDDWSDLSECFMEMAEEEVQRTKLAIVKTFAEGVARPIKNNGRAPVLTGNWLANNELVYNKPNNNTNSEFDKEGVSATNEIIRKTKLSKPFQTVVIQNNSEYNTQVEYTGWSYGWNKKGSKLEDTPQSTPPYRPYRKSYEELRAKLDNL